MMIPLLAMAALGGGQAGSPFEGGEFGLLERHVERIAEQSHLKLSVAPVLRGRLVWIDAAGVPAERLLALVAQANRAQWVSIDGGRRLEPTPLPKDPVFAGEAERYRKSVARLIPSELPPIDAVLAKVLKPVSKPGFIDPYGFGADLGLARVAAALPVEKVLALAPGDVLLLGGESNPLPSAAQRELTAFIGRWRKAFDTAGAGKDLGKYQDSPVAVFLGLGTRFDPALLPRIRVSRHPGDQLEVTVAMCEPSGLLRNMASLRVAGDPVGTIAWLPDTTSDGKRTPPADGEPLDRLIPTLEEIRLAAKGPVVAAVPDLALPVLDALPAGASLRRRVQAAATAGTWRIEKSAEGVTIGPPPWLDGEPNQDRRQLRILLSRAERDTPLSMPEALALSSSLPEPYAGSLASYLIRKESMAVDLALGRQHPAVLRFLAASAGFDGEVPIERLPLRARRDLARAAKLGSFSVIVGDLSYGWIPMAGDGFGAGGVVSLGADRAWRFTADVTWRGSGVLVMPQWTLPRFGRYLRDAEDGNLFAGAPDPKSIERVHALANARRSISVRLQSEITLKGMVEVAETKHTVAGLRWQEFPEALRKQIEQAMQAGPP